MGFCLSSLGFLLSERTSGVSPVIFMIIINWMCRFGWVESINFIGCHPSNPHHYDKFPILCHKRDSIMRYLLGPGGLSARPPLAQCKGSPVRADHIISIRSKLSKNHLRHPNHQDHNNSSIQIFCQRGTSNYDIFVRSRWSEHNTGQLGPTRGESVAPPSLALKCNNSTVTGEVFIKPTYSIYPILSRMNRSL